jgi:AraC-like DNA-binding protein
MAREDLKELASRLRAHPRFLPAAARCTEEFIAWRARLGVLNKVISTLSRERILEHLLYLHFARDPAVDPGATFERLAALSELHDGVGARSVRTTLRLAQIAGHVILTRSLKDGRLRLYEPAEPLLAQVAEFYCITLGVLEDLAPEFRVRSRLRGEPGFLRAMIGRVGRAYLAYDFRAGSDMDGYSNALRLEGARPILAAVVDCYLSQRVPPSALELARRFHVSPSQTRAVFKTVEAHGLVRLAGRGRLLDAEPLTEAYLGALCRSLAFFALNALETPFDAFSADTGAN